MAQQADSLKSIFYALGANGAIAVAKLVAAVFTGSSAMLAEGIHSLADCGNQGLLLWGVKAAKKPPTPDYPLGFGKAIYFWSFIVALILFTMGGMFSIYEGLHKLDHPEPMSAPWVAVLVLLFAIVAESFSLWGCLKEVVKIQGDRNLWEWFRESRQSELLVVFGEDIAALLGLFVALMSVGMTIITGDPIYDAQGSIVIGVLLILVAIMIGVEVKALLIGQSAEPAVVGSLRAFLEERPEVERVFNLLTLQLGDDLMVAVKAKMMPCESPREMIEAVNRCEVAMKAAFPQVLWSFFEPDIRD